MDSYSEKDRLLHESDRAGSSKAEVKSRTWKIKHMAFPILLILVLVGCYLRLDFAAKPSDDTTCMGQHAIGPKARPDITEKNVEKLFRSKDFKTLSVQRLSGAVQVATENYDDMGPLLEDERWEAFYHLQKYFETTFPLL